MKKTLSWSAETVKRKETPDDVASEARGGQEANDRPMTKSSSVSAPLTSPQVNLRIQQMIAMQKAQNATMRELISTRPGVSSASPSGLRDMVAFASATKGMAGDVPGSIRVEDVESEKMLPSDRLVHSGLGGASKVEPMKPPAPIPMPHAEVADIHFQGQQKSTASLPLHQPPPLQPPSPQKQTVSPPLANLPHLHPVIPDCADSPISYNSVLNQNDSPRKDKIIASEQHSISIGRYDTNVAVSSGNGSHLCTESNPSKSNPPISHLGTQLAQRQPDTVQLRTESDVSPMVPQAHHNFQYGTTPAVLCGPPISHLGTQLARRQPDTVQLRTGSDVSPLLPRAHHDVQYGTAPVVSYGPPHFDSNTLQNYSGDPTYARNNRYSLLEDGARPETPDGTYTPQALQSRIRRARRRFLLAILCYPFRRLLDSERLRRSLCLGAIDGMLTGAAILSACVGLGLFSQLAGGTSTYVKWIPVALTLSATFAEGICMAIGHAWSTRLAADAAREEHREGLRVFEGNRPDAKARLVDALLSRGVRKIDAMSLADTLEGYPDLFVTMLLGGDCAGGFGMTRSASGGSSVLQGQRAHQWDVPSPSNGPGPVSRGEINYESYCDASDCADPDPTILSETVAESKLEGLAMMLSFATCSTIPSLIYVLFPHAVNNALENYSSLPDTLAILVSLGASSAVMFCLGAWKSHFYSSNWCLFGLKSMGILVICVSTGYYVGCAFRVLISS